MGHSVGKAADNAVQRSKKEEKVERSTEKIIASMRNLLASRQAVVPDDVRLLLAEYDKLNDAAKAAAKEAEERCKATTALIDSVDQVRELAKNENITSALAEQGLKIDPEMLQETPGA